MSDPKTTKDEPQKESDAKPDPAPRKEQGRTFGRKGMERKK